MRDFICIHSHFGIWCRCTSVYMVRCLLCFALMRIQFDIALNNNNNNQTSEYSQKKHIQNEILCRCLYLLVFIVWFSLKVRINQIEKRLRKRKNESLNIYIFYIKKDSATKIYFCVYKKRKYKMMKKKLIKNERIDEVNILGKDTGKKCSKQSQLHRSKSYEQIILIHVPDKIISKQFSILFVYFDFFFFCLSRSSFLTVFAYFCRCCINFFRMIAPTVLDRMFFLLFFYCLIVHWQWFDIEKLILSNHK